jgi:hypothetical protein
LGYIHGVWGGFHTFYILSSIIEIEAYKRWEASAAEERRRGNGKWKQRQVYAIARRGYEFEETEWRKH